MNRRIKGLAKAGASLSLAGGILAAAAGPAAAAAPNEAYGAAASGLISVAPVDEATYPGTSPVTAATISITGLLTTGVVTDTAGATSASSTIANVSATLSPLATLTADAVASSCTFDTNTGTVSGTTTITNGQVVVTGLGGTTIALAANPTPNTTVTVPGIATITLNRQTTATDGTLTVDAIYVSLLGTTQTLTIGTSVCNAASVAPVPVLPGKAMAAGLGTLGMLGLGGVVYHVSRRRRRGATA